MIRAGALALVVLAGCLPAVDGRPETNACEDTSDCNGAGEICDVGMCWGDPPAGTFSAILVPPPALADDAVMTAIPALALAGDGWITGPGGGGLSFDDGIVLTGTVTMPCPAAIPTCRERQPLPGKLKWSKPSGIPGGPRLTGSAEVGSDGSFAMPVTRPNASAPSTFTLVYTPSLIPLGPGLPSPAMLMAPYTAEVELTAADIDNRTDRLPFELALDPDRLRTVSGHIVRPPLANMAGWQLQAEVLIEGSGGARQRVSTVALTDGNGDFTLRVAAEYPIVDIVCAPPASDDPVVEHRPSVRARDVVVADLTGPMHDLTVPLLGLPTPVDFEVTGTDSSGGTIAVNGATVIVRLDRDLGNGTSLELEAHEITNGGWASMSLPPLLDGAPLDYTYDVLPGPASELASQYNAALTVGGSIEKVALPRRRSLVGRVLDDEGRQVAGAAVSATLSTATLCALSTMNSRLARSLASAQVATNSRGEFTLFVDNDLAGVPLTYDVAVRPATGDVRPQWSFVDLTPTLDGDRVDLWLPDAASMRGVVLSSEHGPVADAALSVYEQVAGAPSCASTLGASGSAVLRGLSTTDSTGTAAVVLPRPAVQ